MREWMRPFLMGFGGALAAVLIVAVLYGAWLTFIRAANGEAAFEFIQRVNSQQQQAGRGTTPSAKP